jgi:hypothetical protein
MPTSCGLGLSASPRDGDGIKSCRVPLERLTVPYRGNSLVRPGTFFHRRAYQKLCSQLRLLFGDDNARIKQEPDGNG